MENIGNNSSIHDSISQMIDDIRYMLDETGEIIFIECLGTPGSDKTKYTKYLRKLLKSKNMEKNVVRRQDPEKRIIPEETEESESESEVKIRDKDYYSEFLKKRFRTVINDLGKKNQGKIIIYDRGLLDFIVWLNYDYYRATIDFDELNKKGKDALNDDFVMKKFPMQLRKHFFKPDNKKPMDSEELKRLLQVYSPISVIYNITPDLEDEKIDEQTYGIDIDCYKDSLEDLYGSIKDASQKCIYITDIENERKSYEDITFDVLKSIRDYLKLQVPKSRGNYIPFPEDPYPDIGCFH